MRRTASILLVTATLGALTSVALPAASAATPSSLSLSTQNTSVTTSTGKSLHISVGATTVTTKGDNGDVNLSVMIATGQPYGKGESHIWRFTTSRGSFVYNSSTGKGTLDTG